MRPAASPDLPADFVAGNVFDKYRTRNPVYRWLVGRFLAGARELAVRVRPRRVLEVGCGPGDLAAALFTPGPAWNPRPPEYVGTDVSGDQVRRARTVHPALRFRTASAYRLPFPGASFDLVIACEVLEHLDDPRRALVEMSRVGDGHFLLSVPWEPVWRMLNLARGAYLARLGDTPGHVQHFTRRSFVALVAERFDVVEVRRPLPWTLLLARSRSEN